MKKSVLLIIITGLFLACEIMAQAPGDTLWTRTFGGNLGEECNSVIQTNDGGFVMAGWSDSYGPGQHDGWIVKTDSAGNELWTKAYGSVGSDVIWDIKQTNDGGLIATGRERSSNYFKFWLLRMNSEGDTLWTRKYGGDEDDIAHSVCQTSDGGFIMGGHTRSFGAEEDDIYLVRTDSNGDTLWTKTYGGDGIDQIKEVNETDDGGFIICGITFSYDHNFLVIRTDSVGNTLWYNTYGNDNDNYEGSLSIKQTNDGGSIIAGFAFDANWNMDAYLIKIDSQGDTLWTRKYGDTEHDETFYSVQVTNDGGFILGGYKNNPGGNVDCWLVRTNSAGDTLWTNTVGGDETDMILSVAKTTDGGYIAGGLTKSFGAGDTDFYLLRIAGDSQPPLNPPQNLFVTEEAYATWDVPSSKDLLGYNVYLDGDSVGYTTGLFYQYEDLINEQTYVAGVSAVYDEGESAIVEYEFTYLYVGIENNITPATELLGNYPNPFNSSTTISFSVEGSDKNIQITIHNFSGQKIKTLVDKKLETGTHQIAWNGTDDSGNQVSSGIYFYKMKHGDKYTGFKKMIMMK